MIVTIARQVIKPECFDTYHALAKELAEASRAEAGCVGYRSVQAEEDNRVHLFIECWKDQRPSTSTARPSTSPASCRSLRRCLQTQRS